MNKAELLLHQTILELQDADALLTAQDEMQCLGEKILPQHIPAFAERLLYWRAERARRTLHRRQRRARKINRHV